MAKKLRQPEYDTGGDLVFTPHRDEKTRVRLCLECFDPATWVRSGDGAKHHFCNIHASQRPDFDIKSADVLWVRNPEKLQDPGFDDGQDWSTQKSGLTRRQLVAGAIGNLIPR